MSDQDHLTRAVESFRRCNDEGQLVRRFYELFLASSPEVADKFRGTDFVRQRRMLEESLHTLLAAGGIPASGPIRAHLERVAYRHSRAELAIPPALYDLWLDCLIQAVRELDPEFSTELREAWRQALEPGIEFMRLHY